MIKIINLNESEVKRLYKLLAAVENLVSSDLKVRVHQARMIYCNVKKNLTEIFVSGDDIKNLTALLTDLQKIRFRNWAKESGQLLTLIVKKESENVK